MSSSAFLDNLKQLFAECDTDKNGSLGRDEFHQLCTKIGLDSGAANETFERLDVDGNDRITFEEFAAGFNQYSKQSASPSPTSGSPSPSEPGQVRSMSRIRSASSSKVSALARQKNAGQIGVMSLGSTSSSCSAGSSAGASSSTASGRAHELAGQAEANSRLSESSYALASQPADAQAEVPILVSQYEPKSIVYDSETQSGFGSLMSDSSLNQVKTFQDLFECIQKLQNENQILSQTFFKDKREREEYISQLGEEFDQQVKEVEERANRRARLELEAEKKRLREMMQAERETLRHHYQTIEKMSKLIKSNMVDGDGNGSADGLLGDDVANIVNVKSKLEDTYLENRKLKKSLLDTKSDVALIRKEMEKLKSQYELKLSSAHERNDETRNECDHIKQQLDLMKDSNRKLQDASDVITNYITDKIDPVIKGAYTPGEDTDSGYFLSPNAGPASHLSGHSRPNSRKGSILSEYLNVEESEEEEFADVKSRSSLQVESKKKQQLGSQIEPSTTADVDQSKRDENEQPKKVSNDVTTSLASDPGVESSDGDSKATFNIILVGDSFVGKSSFAARFMEGTFVQGLISNCSIDFKTKAYKVDGVNYTVNLWDTA